MWCPCVLLVPGGSGVWLRDTFIETPMHSTIGARGVLPCTGWMEACEGHLKVQAWVYYAVQLINSFIFLGN